MSNLKIALNGRHLFLSMLIVIFFTFTSLSSIFWLASTSSRASSAALQRFYFLQTVQPVPDLLAEKVFTLLQLLAFLKQPFGKISRKKDSKLTLSGQSQHRPHWQVCGSFAQVESVSPGTYFFYLAYSMLSLTFTGASLSCKFDFSSRMRRLSLVASLPAATRWVCNKSRARVLSPILSLFLTIWFFWKNILYLNALLVLPPTME